MMDSARLTWLEMVAELRSVCGSGRRRIGRGFESGDKCCGELVLEQFAHGGDKSALSLLAARYRVGLRLPLARSLVNVSGADF